MEAKSKEQLGIQDVNRKVAMVCVALLLMLFSTALLIGSLEGTMVKPSSGAIYIVPLAILAMVGSVKLFKSALKGYEAKNKVTC